MKLGKNIKFAGALTLFGILGLAGDLCAKENVVSSQHKGLLKTTDAGCQPATATIDLDINNVRARLMTGGDMWWNIGLGNAAYEIPKGSGKSSQFAASCWIGGKDKQGQLKVAAQTYRQDGNDYWPGVLDENAKVNKATCDLWDKQWKVNRATINQFIQLSKSGGNTQTSQFDIINTWPGVGNIKAKGSGGLLNLNSAPYLSRTYATFKDLNADGIYQPEQGEYPVLESNNVQSLPDQMIWWVFNDAGNVKQQSLTSAIGVEVQTTAFAFATQDFLNNSTFCNYRVINRGTLSLDSAYIAVWDDCDLGYAYDDFIGCDTSKGLGIMYNGTNCDGCAAGSPVNSYGLNPPMVGLDFFQGPSRIIKGSKGQDSSQRLNMTNFTYYNNDFSTIGNPSNGIQIYFYMTGSIRNGQRFAYDFNGSGIPSKGYGSGPVSNFVFWGDPGDNSQWSECACSNNPGDRRFIFSAGPFNLLPGAINDITFGCVWAPNVGGCGATNFNAIKNVDIQAQSLFDSHFKTVEGPEAPDLKIVELDRKLILYLVNPQGSNNYGENYGNTSGSYNDSLQYHQFIVKSKGVSNDSLYKFQGYRVFQLANSQVSSSDIFDPTTGQVDNTKAVEVFQCDIHDGVTQIVNYTKNIAVSDTTNTAQIKVVGKDSGIVHSFVLTNDQFSNGSDKRFINYHNYYFVAIAYAYNNFASFNPRFTISTQDQPYIGSSHSAGGNDIKVITALPNPTNLDMGTLLSSDYGSGVSITRFEGVGNGGNDIQLTDSSELEAVNNNQVNKAVYVTGKGPIDVKVVDPTIIGAYNWTLQMLNDTARRAFDSTATWRLSAYKMNGDLAETIYSEHTINTINEQILAKYGISVNVKQPKAPGVDQLDHNGYITSDVTFEDVTKPWLAGVKDEADSSFANWLRAGKNKAYKNPSNAVSYPCNFNDNTAGGFWLDSNLAYQNMFADYTPTKSTWGPYVLGAYYFNGHAGYGTQCGFEVAWSGQSQNKASFATLPDIDLVFTDDKSKWTVCAVIEEQEDPVLAEGFQKSDNSKFYLRKHRSWHGLTDPNNKNVPVYSSVDTDMSMSLFPGYAIDQSTGKRLNIVFGEDSYLENDNGNDMIWNPTSNKFNNFDNSILFGGKHIVYVLNTQYDSDRVFKGWVRGATGLNNNLYYAFQNAAWVGIPLLGNKMSFKSLADGQIPTKTRLRFRVNRPYGPYAAVDTNSLTKPAPIAGSKTNPYYSFSTQSLVPKKRSDNPDRGGLADRIFAVPNPYYGYSGYENNRFDTKVRIINLPTQAYINIYSLDGALIRSLSKTDPNTPYVDWDLKNTVGLQICSGMYLIHVNAVGIGETVIKWFGAMRPLDVTSY